MKDDLDILRALRDALWVKVVTGALTNAEALARLHAAVDFYYGRFRYVRKWGQL